MRQSFVAVVLLAASVVACNAGSSTTPSPVASPTEGKPTAQPSATGTPLPVPIEVSWAALGGQADGTLVSINGRVRAGFLVSCFNHLCGILLADPLDADNEVGFDVHAVTSAGVPNTMVELPSSFGEADLRLTGDDGTTLGSGDVLRVVAWVEQHDSNVTLTAERFEAAPEPAPTPTPTAAPTPVAPTVTFAELARLPEGSAVRIKGVLSLPFITSCGATCSLHLDEPRTSRWAYIQVPVLGSDDEQRNGMLELPSNYRDRDLTVYAADGSRLGAGDRAWIIGTLDNAPSEDTRSIEVIAIEPAA
jgi:hypothetical protein